MKPQKIILIRHGQSKGNVDRTEYGRTPDFAVKLTDVGCKQAIEAGRKLNEFEGNFQFYVSSYHRTRQTFDFIRNGIDIKKRKIFFREEPRLREQEWSNGSIQIDLNKNETLEIARDSVGTFYYRFPGGESCSDVYDRLSDFMNTLHRDFEKPDFPENCVIVSHGMSIRVFLMRWFHMTVEQFETLKNPKNCSQIVLNLQPNGKYELQEELQRHDKPTHPYHFPLQ